MKQGGGGGVFNSCVVGVALGLFRSSVKDSNFSIVLRDLGDLSTLSILSGPSFLFYCRGSSISKN